MYQLTPIAKATLPNQPTTLSAVSLDELSEKVVAWRTANRIDQADWSSPRVVLPLTIKDRRSGRSHIQYKLVGFMAFDGSITPATL